MKRLLSLILSFVIVLSAIPFSALLANAESAEMTVTPSRYGAWENWINSPNIVGDYDAVTQLLLEATDASGNPLVLPADAQWSLTISWSGGSKTIQMNPATTLPSANLYRFETCNGTGENKFVPTKGVNYSVCATISSGGAVIYESATVSGFTCGMEPIDPAVPMEEPQGTVSLAVAPNFGHIENYGTPARTFFIVGVNAAEGNTLMYNRLKRGVYKLYVTVTNETDGTTSTVYYPITKPAIEYYGTSFMRLALAERGIVPVAGHSYTLELNVYSGDELKYTGKSAKGAFLSTQESFIKNGAIIPELPEKNEENVLTGKSVLFVGDSITEAICEVNIAQTHIAAGWPGRIGMANEMFFINKGLSGASISNCRGTNTVLAQLQSMKTSSFDLLIMHGGVNDAWDSAPVGQMTALTNFDETTFDQSTFAGGLEYLFWYAKTYYPDAVKGYIINFRLPGSNIGRLSDMSEYFAVARDICDKWDIPYLDMYANDELNARMKATTRYALGDYIHPNERGYDILYPYVEQFCQCIMEGGDPSKLTDPEKLPEQGSSITDSDVNVALGKKVTSGAGTTSTVPTDGKTDAYFYAGDWGTAEAGSYGTGGNCYIQIDLGYYYDIDKLNVVTFIGNLLYQWEAYATTDATLSIDKWTRLGAKDGFEMSYEDGYTLSFEKTSARYVRIYGIYDNASTAFVFNEVSVYGTPSNETEEDVSKVSGGSATLPDNSKSDKLTDGNKTTDALVVTPKDGGTLIYDLGAVTELQTIKTYTAGTDSSYGIYGSLDGQSWTLLGVKELNKTSEAYDSNVGWCNVMSVSGSYRYLRWQWLNSTRADGYVSAAEIEVFAKGSDTKMTGITATVTNAVYGANNTLDGNYKSYCFLCRKNDGTVIDLGEAVDLRYATLYPAGCDERLIFAASADGKSWIAMGYAPAGNTDAVTGYLIGEYRYFKIYTESGAGYSAYELEIYAAADEPAVDPDPPVDPDEPDNPAVETELSNREGVTVTVGAGLYTNNINDGINDKNYVLLNEGDKCYAILDLQKSYALTKVVVNTLNGNYLFEVYGSVDGSEYVKLGANEASTSYVAAEGFVVEVSGNYRFVKIVGTGCQNTYFGLYEIDVYGAEIPAGGDTEEPDVPVDPDPPVDPDEPDNPAVETELSNREGVTVTVGAGLYTNNINDGINDKNYVLLNEGDKCYAILDLQQSYALSKVVVNAINGNYLFEVYGSVNGSEYVKLGANEASTSYVAAEGFVVEVSGNYRYVKVVGTGCQNGYFTIYEIDVYGVEKEATDPIKGDVDCDGTLSISDVTELLSVLAGTSTLKEGVDADLDKSGNLSISDVTVLLNALAGVVTL